MATAFASDRWGRATVRLLLLDTGLVVSTLIAGGAPPRMWVIMGVAVGIPAMGIMALSPAVREGTGREATVLGALLLLPWLMGLSGAVVNIARMGPLWTAGALASVGTAVAVAWCGWARTARRTGPHRAGALAAEAPDPAAESAHGGPTRTGHRAP
jgi:hypothetical protein